MAASPVEDRVALLDLASDAEVFDIIDPNFDPAFSELTGVASADYIPMEADEVLIKKGDSLRIDEETLDRQHYIVTVMQTKESGRVPKEFVTVDDATCKQRAKTQRGSMFLEGVEWEDYAEPPPHGEPFKRTQGLIRRPGVERSKRPVYKARVNGVDVSDQGPQLEETMKPGMEAARGFTASEQVPGLSAVARLREITREERAQTLQPRPEFKLIEKYNIVSVGGSDRDGRMVIVFSACRLPDSYLINHQRLLEYIFHTLEQYVEQDYTVIYFHNGFSSSNKPSLGWLKQVYQGMDRKYKKNIKRFYIVHPTNFIRVFYYILKPLISYKFGQKLVYINRLDELRPVLYLDQIDVPDEVKRYDLTLTTPIRDVTKLESRSVFHVPVSAVNSPPPPLDTQQFGVPLDDLRVRYNGDPVPPVLKMCVHAIEEKGMDVMGIFRRAPNNSTLHKVKDMFNRGDKVDLSELGDCHLSAVLMKLFLRELPEPLLTFRAYASIVEIRGKSEENRLEIIQKVLSFLPETNYIVLRYIMEFLSKVAANQELNKMTEMNLAIVFGPNLAWSSSETANLSSLGEINSFTLLLIKHFDLLFNK
ncbi:rho GTPase-activating protein 8-like isoform X2 [Halichondria panicea]|uniref:rho GTPase-activating protein 8-like isoform X2 n=1 Tax=Halichondria panicea TaxID=6063 RepID=UPI00312B4C54